MKQIPVGLQKLTGLLVFLLEMVGNMVVLILPVDIQEITFMVITLMVIIPMI